MTSNNLLWPQNDLNGIDGLKETQMALNDLLWPLMASYGLKGLDGLIQTHMV